MRIVDPANRLPVECRPLLQVDVDGQLIIPDCGVPLHVDTVRRFAGLLKGGAWCYLPTVRVASELGLPAYTPLAYWLPKESHVGLSAWFRKRLPWRRAEASEIDLASFSGRRLTETGAAEEIHYFADWFCALKPSPVQVSVVVSNVCNLRCVMCPYHSPSIRPKHTTDFFGAQQWMEWEMMVRLAEECGAMRVPVKMGNIEEPLLHPRIVDFIRKCREKGVPSVHVTSNGWPLRKEMALRLLDAGLTSLYVSLDAAWPETYRRIRGLELAKVEQNILDFLEMRRELKMPCRLLMSFVRNEGVSREEAIEFRDKWLPLSDGVIIYNLAQYSDGNSHFQKVNDVAVQKMRSTGGRWACLNPFQEVYVLPDGRVYYCCETVSKLAFEKLESMGMFPRQSLKEIWAGPLFAELRRDLLRNSLMRWPACHSCGIWMAHVTGIEEEPGRKVTRNMITEVWERK